jgi:hypothetical protein
MADAFLDPLLVLADERPHVHGFHPYPARFSPGLAGPLVRTAAPGAVVFDPFAGSATTLVEARLHGCRAWGNDLNPIAVLLCRVKADPLPLKVFGALENDLQYLRRYVYSALRNKEEDENIELPPGERLFEPHVYWELQTIVGGIERLRHPHNQEIFAAALSAIVTRVSKQLKESQPDERRESTIGAKRTATLFFETAEELLDDLRLFSRQARGGELRVWQTDARELKGVPDAEVDLVVTSPPYGGTYDYAAMHAGRGLWLGFEWKAFDKLEIGARRRQAQADATTIFRSDFSKVFKQLARVCKPAAAVYWVVADGVIGGTAYRGDELSAAAAAKSGWKLVRKGETEVPAWSEMEQEAFGDAGKREYILHFAR